MSRLGAARCQCSSSASKRTRSPGRMTSTGPPAALAQAYALGDEDGLAQRVAVPVRAGAGHEVHEVGGDARRRRCCGHSVDVDVSGEPVSGTLGGIDGAARDLHEDSFYWSYRALSWGVVAVSAGAAHDARRPS